MSNTQASPTTSNGDANSSIIPSPHPDITYPNYLVDLSDAQKNIFNEFKQRLKEEGILPGPTGDGGEEQWEEWQVIQLIRFLRARSWNIDAATLMYQKSLEWRKSIDIDNLVETFVFNEKEEVAKHGWRHYFHKTDKLGRPIYIQSLRNISPTPIFQLTTPERVIQNFAVTLETAVKYRYTPCSKTFGRNVRDNFMIVDIGGLGMTTFWNMRNQLRELLSVLDNNFPELSGRVQIINAPWVFSSIWGWIKPWLPPQTVKKIDISGADYKKTLLEFIDEENLPKDLGGKCDECEKLMNEKGERANGDGEGKEKGGSSCLRSDLGPWDSEKTRR